MIAFLNDWTITCCNFCVDRYLKWALPRSSSSEKAEIALNLVIDNSKKTKKLSTNDELHRQLQLVIHFQSWRFWLIHRLRHKPIIALNESKYTIWTESKTFYRLSFIRLEHTLCLITDAVQLDQIIKSCKCKQVHICRPKSACHLWSHQFLNLYEKLLWFLLVHQFSNQTITIIWNNRKRFKLFEKFLILICVWFINYYL